jgi:hypothetical protein
MSGSRLRRPAVGDKRLPLEQRIGSVRDGDTTDHGTPIGSTPLAVQPPRRPNMDDIVDRLRKSEERPYCYCALFKGYAAEALEAADEIQRLRAIITRQAMELLIAHSEALGLYDLTTLPAKEAT